MKDQDVKYMVREISTHARTATDYRVRIEIHKGERYLIVPVVMMVEGVHSGSMGPLYHPAEELKKAVPGWTGIPVTIDHPQNAQGQYISANSPDQVQNSVGEVINPRMDGKKLKADLRLNEQKLMAMSPEALSHIHQGKPLDVSVGVFTDEEVIDGEWEGEVYHAIAREQRPDHLALLPGGQGACSWQDGCGIRVNSDMNQKKGGIDVTMMGNDRFGVHSFQVDESYQERIQQIRQSLEKLNSESGYHYLADVYEDHFIFEKESKDNSTEIFRQNYAMADSGIAWVGDPQKVKREVRYLATNQDGSMIRTKSPSTNKQGGTTMAENQKSPCFIRRVDELIANADTRFTEEDKEWLLAQEESILEKLAPMEKPAVDPDPDPEPPQVNVEQAIAVLKEHFKNPDQFIQIMPDDMQEQMRTGLKLHQEQRQGLIDNILSNTAQGVWSDEELKKMDTGFLEKLSSSIKAKMDYSGQGPTNHRDQGSDEILLPTGMDSETK
jgi:hypothetical protein